MESHLGVKQPAHDSWRGIEMPEPAVPKLASSKTVFEMVDVESVRLSPPPYLAGLFLFWLASQFSCAFGCQKLASWVNILAPDHEAATDSTIFGAQTPQGDSPVFLPLLSRVPLRSTPLSELPADSSATSSSSTSGSSTSSARRTKVVPASRPGRAPTAFTDLSGTKQGREMMKTYEGGTKRGSGGGELARRRAQQSSSE